MTDQLFHLRDGERRKGDVNRVVDGLMNLPTDKPFEAEIRPYHNGVSHQQRRLYRMWLKEMAEFSGDDPEALHEHFLKAYAPRIVKSVKGESIEIIKRTGANSTDMKVPEMAEYMTKIQRDAALMGITLTQPEDKTW